MIFIALKERTSKIWRTNVFENRTLELVSWFPSSSPPVKKTLQQVSPMLSSPETNLLSSVLFLSDQLEYALHLLLSPVSLQWVSPKHLVFEMIHNPLDFAFSVVKPAFSAILHLQDPSLQCFPLSHNRNSSVTGYRTSRHPHFQIHPYLWW